MNQDLDSRHEVGDLGEVAVRHHCGVGSQPRVVVILLYGLDDLMQALKYARRQLEDIQDKNGTQC